MVYDLFDGMKMFIKQSLLPIILCNSMQKIHADNWVVDPSNFTSLKKKLVLM